MIAAARVGMHGVRGRERLPVGPMIAAARVGTPGLGGRERLPEGVIDR
jgi:hypothetical protein